MGPGRSTGSGAGPHGPVQYPDTLKALLILAVCLCLGACASVRAPEGGPKDKTPPRLLKTSPKNEEANLKQEDLLLDFSEGVQEDNPKVPFLSPVTQVTTTVTGRRIRIRADSGLKPNTTYTLNLSGKIKDEREGNPLADTLITFSTGNQRDTLTFLWSARDNEGKKPKTRYTAILKRQNGQRYFGQADTGKANIIRGLPSERFQIEVFADRNENLRYEDEDGPLFFDTLNPEITRNLTIQPLPHRSKKITLFKLRQHDTCQIESSQPIVIYGQFKDYAMAHDPTRTLFKLYPLRNPFILEYADSLGTCYEDTLIPAKTDTTRSLTPVGLKQERKIGRKGKDLQIQYRWNGKITRFPERFSWTWDSVWTTRPCYRTENEDAYTFTIRVPELKTGKLRLKFDSLRAQSGKYFLRDSALTGTPETDAEGSITGTVEGNWQNPIVELLDETLSLAGLARGQTFSFTVRPGKYSIQVFDDLNRDGRYTGGNKAEKRKAEPLLLYRGPAELRPGWDLENIRIGKP